MYKRYFKIEIEAYTQRTYIINKKLFLMKEIIL